MSRTRTCRAFLVLDVGAVLIHSDAYPGYFCQGRPRRFDDAALESSSNSRLQMGPGPQPGAWRSQEVRRVLKALASLYFVSPTSAPRAVEPTSPPRGTLKPKSTPRTPSSHTCIPRTLNTQLFPRESLESKLGAPSNAADSRSAWRQNSDGAGRERAWASALGCLTLSAW